MPLNLSPPGDVIKLFGHRNLASIPKDQQALLEASDSWAVDLKNTPLGALNVPGHVLETVKEAHIARISAALQLRAQSSPPRIQSKPPAQSPSTDSQRRKGGPSGSAHSSSPHNVSHTQNDDAESPPPSSPGQSIPWSPSPERPQPVRPAAIESHIVRETPKTAPMGPPPRPLPVFSPPSSGPEEDLEMELPQPQVRRDPPLNRAAAPPTATAESPIASGARVMDTPPCAQPTHPTQPVIPNTVVAEEVAAPPTQRAPLEQRRRMKPIRLENKTPKKNVAGQSRLAPTKTFTQVESSNSTSPSSVIPATFDEPTTPGPVLQSVENVEVIDVDELDNQRNEDSREPVIVESQIRAPMTSSNQSQGAIPDSQPPFPRISLSGDVQPYTAFKMAYPEYEETYNGDTWEFIKSCVVLEFLRRQRLLRDCIYDDFIRAFPGYQTYFNGAGPGQEPLPAIEWFNNLQGPLVFNRMMVTKSNLGYILDYYPKEVARARRIINNDSDEGVAGKRQTAINHNGAMDIDSEEPAQQLSWTPTANPANVSQAREVLTQAPPPPSPKWNSSALPSSMKTPNSKTKTPRPSQYFQRLAASAKASSTPQRRTAEQRAKLREHFLKRKGSGVGSVASSRIRRS